MHPLYKAEREQTWLMWQDTVARVVDRPLCLKAGVGKGSFYTRANLPSATFHSASSAWLQCQWLRPWLPRPGFPRKFSESLYRLLMSGVSTYTFKCRFFQRRSVLHAASSIQNTGVTRTRFVIESWWLSVSMVPSRLPFAAHLLERFCAAVHLLLWCWIQMQQHLSTTDGLYCGIHLVRISVAIESNKQPRKVQTIDHTIPFSLIIQLVILPYKSPCRLSICTWVQPRTAHTHLYFKVIHYLSRPLFLV